MHRGQSNGNRFNIHIWIMPSSACYSVLNNNSTKLKQISCFFFITACSEEQSQILSFDIERQFLFACTFFREIIFPFLGCVPLWTNNRFGFGGLPPGSLGGANVTTTTYPSQPQTETYPPQHQGNTSIPLLPPQPYPAPHQAYTDTKGPELPPAYHDVMESTTSSYPTPNPDPSAPKILPYTTQPAFNPHAM